MQPLPEDAEADLTGGHILHQIEDIVIAEEIGQLQCRGLETLAEGVAVLQGDAEQVARAADRARGRLEQGQAALLLRRPHGLDTAGIESKLA